MKKNEKTGTNPADTISFPTRIVLSSGTLALGEFQNLRRGSELEVHLPSSGNALLYAGGYYLAEGKLEEKEGRFGFRVVRIFTREERQFAAPPNGHYSIIPRDTAGEPETD